MTKKHHHHTEPAEVNFDKLKNRLLQINNHEMGKYNEFKKFLFELEEDGRPTLIMATGGSKPVALFLQLILDLRGILSEVIEPRDYEYKENIVESYANLVCISSSGKTNGIQSALKDFKGRKYLISENNDFCVGTTEQMSADYHVISWGNELYEVDREKSFISLVSTLGPMLLLFDAALFERHCEELLPLWIMRVNQTLFPRFSLASNNVDTLDYSFTDTDIIQIMSGVDTRVSACVLDSCLTEVGAGAVVVHDKGSFCHGRSNLLYKYPDSAMIFLSNSLSDFETKLLQLLHEGYPNVFTFDSSDFGGNILSREFYLSIQMYYLSKKIAQDKGIDLTQPEYDPHVVKELYYYKGEM